MLSLYKECMRAAKLKPGFEQTVRTEFKRNAALPRYFLPTDFKLYSVFIFRVRIPNM